MLNSYGNNKQNSTTQLNSDMKSIIQIIGNMTTPNSSEGIIHANWSDNMVPIAIRVKKYDQWRYNVLGMALYGKELYLIEVPYAYQGCPCEVIYYKSNQNILIPQKVFFNPYKITTNFFIFRITNIGP